MKWKQQRDVKIGTITNVSVEDSGAIYVTVSHTPTNESKDVLFKSPSPNIWAVPEVGDVAEVFYLENDYRIARTPFSLPDTEAPSGLSEGDIAIKIDNIEIVFDKDSGSLDLRASDITLSADQITIGENGEAVATASHTHSAPDGGGTTSGPSDVTDTTIE